MSHAIAQMTDTEFNLYSLLLAISGILLVVTAATGFGGRTALARGINGVFGIAFLVYAIYLQFIFNGGTVFVSYYVFVVPVLLIIQAFRNRSAAKQAAAQPPAQRTGVGDATLPTEEAAPGPDAAH